LNIRPISEGANADLPFEQCAGAGGADAAASQIPTSVWRQYEYACRVSLALRNVLFTIVVPGMGALYAPW
jgi:hypothetical protein